MPEQPPRKQRPSLDATSVATPDAPLAPRPSVAYAELRCKSNFSFLHGASHAEELVQQAARLGHRALAITDFNSLAGIVRAHVAAKEAGIKLLVGAEITPEEAPSVVLLATDRAAYGRLCRLITVGRRRAEKGKCRLFSSDIADHAEGLIACVVPADHLASRGSEPVGSPAADSGRNGSLARIRIRNAEEEETAGLGRYKEAFGDRCYALAHLHRGPDDERRLRTLVARARRAGVCLVASNDVHFHIPERQALQDCLIAIREGRPVDAVGEWRFPNAERYLKPPDEMAALFHQCPKAILRTVEIADRCSFSLDELRYEYPEELCPEGITPLEHLTRLAWRGARDRYPDGVPDKVRGLLEHELKLIAQLGYEAYFLTVWDLVRFARDRGILCQGRGSAANSVVCYCLGVTSVDPERIDVLFERFVSKERAEAPDIDVDFEHERREEVLQYLYDKYGRERAGIAAEVITYRTRSAIRDVGKALGLSEDRVDSLAKTVENFREDAKLVARCREVGFDADSPVGRKLIGLVGQLLGFPRHLSQHVGGMVITHGPLCELVPIENAAMPGRTVVEWDKDDLDALGILKVDCLALGMLTCIRKCFDLLDRHAGLRLSLASVPKEDPRVYDMACVADTMGVFQIESRAQMSMLPRLKPRCFYDLVIEVAIVRPGPIQGDMVHPYLKRRAGEESVEFPSPAIEAVLAKTMGVPLFQEQAMRLAVVAAGFTPGEADQLRRAMAAWRRPGLIEQFRRKLIDGMTANGLTAEFAERVFKQIQGFGEYGFPESHAASFALLVYVSAWLKCHHPAIFAAGLLNSQPMGFYAPAQLVRNAREHGAEVRPVDVNHSHWDCTIETDAAGSEPRSFSLRLGLRMVSGFSERHAASIERARQRGPFRSLDDFSCRTRLPRAAIVKLARADVFESLRLDRRAALWRSLDQEPELPLFAGREEEEAPIELPSMAPGEEVIADYRTIGLSLRAHPMSFVRADLERRNVTPAERLERLPDGLSVCVAGLVLLRQQPSTAKGIRFVTLEDETGVANLVIRPHTWERYHHLARSAVAYLAHGKLESRHGVIHLLTHRIEDLSALLHNLRQPSRDFR